MNYLLSVVKVFYQGELTLKQSVSVISWHRESPESHAEYAQQVYVIPKELLKTPEKPPKLLDPGKAAKKHSWSVTQVLKEFMTVVAAWPLSLFDRNIQGARASVEGTFVYLTPAGLLLYRKGTAVGRLRLQLPVTKVCRLCKEGCSPGY